MIKKLFEAPRPAKRFISLSYDCAAITLALYLAICLRLGTLTPPFETAELSVLLLTIVVSLLVFVRMGMYRAILRYMSTTAMISIVVSICISGVVLTAMSFFTHSAIPRSVPFIYTLLAFLLIGTPRLLVRSIVLMLNNNSNGFQEPVLIYGAGHTGHQLALALQTGNYKILGFIDDNRRLHGTTIT